MSVQNNPLLSEALLPLFNQILPAHIEPAIETLLENNRLAIQNLLKSGHEKVYTWENLVEPLNILEKNLSNAWSTVAHLSSTMDSPELRAAHDLLLPKLSEYYTELGQNDGLYKAFLSISLNDNFKYLSAAQQKVIGDHLTSFRLSGIALNAEDKAKLKDIKSKLADLESQFEHNVLDATENWCLHVTDLNELKGIPEDALKLFVQEAKKRDMQGWVITLGYANYHAVMCYAENRSLREKVYQAYAMRASEIGPDVGKWDNGPVMKAILNLRQAQAALLGFKDFREYSLETKMANNPDVVTQFLLNLAQRSHPKALMNLKELQDFALEKYQLSNIAAWDISFLGEQLCENKYQISEEILKSYFPIHKVLEGLFSITQTLFGMRTVEILAFEKWHPSVRLFEIYDSEDRLRGKFFLDLYAREHKREGAWVSDCRTGVKWQDGSTQLPVAYIVTNIAPAINGSPALLRHDDVITVFHEFGHCLHHILSTIEYYEVSGHHGVEWDAIELPSQLMENWCWERGALDMLTEHVETKKSLPHDLFKNLKASKTFLAGIHLLRQLEFAMVDFDLHAEANRDIQQTVNSVREKIAVIPVPDYNRFQHSFTHIFAGGYAAGYYSYLWAEILSADIYESFKKEGFLNPIVGHRYLSTILEKGGSKPAMDLFIDFQGRAPTVDALLRELDLS